MVKIGNKYSWGYHILAVITIFVWGTTFASTKVLLNHNLTPSEIMCYRFFIAYLLSWFCSRKLFANSVFDEFLMAVAGIMGGTVYFVAENTALEYTITSNVALIVCSTPVFTALLAILYIKTERLTSKLIIGSCIALIGMAFVVLNGAMLEFNPIGDSLALVAAVSWAIYSVVLQRLDGRYDMWFVTRKIFFYGLITMLPFLFIDKEPLHINAFAEPIVIMNILFLGIIASLICFYTWNVALEKLGSICISNYLYLQPIVSLICSVLILHEPLTTVACVGTVFILFGIYVSQQGLPKIKRQK